MARPKLPPDEVERLLARAVDARRDGVTLSELFRRFNQVPRRALTDRLRAEGLLERDQFPDSSLRHLCAAPLGSWRGGGK